MAKCFVMQPFDGGVFDKRYDGVVEPAIRAAGLEPYRVDRDPAASIPIDQIEAGIRGSDVCVAEITLDNPNVWFELGYAIACDKPVVLVCSSERRNKFPFDVQHRHVIRYSPDSPKDFDELQHAIATRLRAVMEKEMHMQELAASPVLETSGLEPHEITALITVMQTGLAVTPPSGYEIERDMEKAGYTKIAAVLAVKQLGALGLVESYKAEDFNGESYIGYSATDAGAKWLLNNQARIHLRKRSGTQDYSDFEEAEELPF